MKKLFAVVALLASFGALAQVSGYPQSPRIRTLNVYGAGPHSITGAPDATVQLFMSGSFSSASSAHGFYVGSTLSPIAAGAAFGAVVNPTLNKAGSGTHLDFVGLEVRAPTIGAGAAALTNATSLKIVNAPSVGTNQRALWVAAGTSQFDGSVTSGKSCAANYTRITPNFCLGSPFATSVWTNAAACTARTFPNALPAEAKAVVLHTVWRALAGNAIGDRTQSINSFSTGACTGGTATANLVFRVREQVATAAGTDIGEVVQTMIIPLTATNTFASTQLNAGGNGNAEVTSYGAVGYFD
jgi:hypothetical protein